MLDALDNFHAVTGLARSQLLSQLLSEVVPVVNAMTEAYRVSKKAPSKALEPLHDLVHQSSVNMNQLDLQLRKQPAASKLRRSSRK